MISCSHWGMFPVSTEIECDAQWTIARRIQVDIDALLFLMWRRDT